jgi:hypothetical protein
MHPRNQKQVENSKQRAMVEYLQESCEISSIIQENEQMGEIVKRLKIVPSLSVVLLNDELMREWQNLIATGSTCLMSYDTTYNLGDFYVSFLTVRHWRFEGDPLFVLGCLIHHKRNRDSHDIFFSHLKKSFPNIDSENLVIVTDRQK